MDAFFSELWLPGALRATAALVLAALAVFAARRSSATLRHRLWALGLGAALVLPLLGSFVPQVARLPLPLLPSADPAPVAFAAPSATLPVAPAGPVIAGAPLPALAPEPEPRRSGLTPAAMWTGLWAAGALAVLAARGMGLAARRRLRRSARPVDDPTWRELAEDLGRGLGIDRPVALLSSPSAAVPMTWGSWRPVILLPEAALAWPVDRRRAVLLHELAHVRRGDAALGALAHLACALHWPNPLVWFAAHRMRSEAEHAADDRVLVRGERPSLYAGHLLAVARALALGPAPPRPVLAMARSANRSSLSRRIGAILDGERPRSSGGRWLRLGTLGLALAGTLGLSTVGCLRVDGLQNSLDVSDSGDHPTRGYFAEARFADQCPAGVLSDRGRSTRVRTHHSGRQEIELRVHSCLLEVDIDGKVRLDETSVLGLESGGSFSVDETSGAGKRSLRVTAGPGGTPVLAYRVDGAERAVDDEARAFLARVILEIHRSTHVGVEDRVARFLAAGGPDAVLAEVGEISTDYLRAVYLRELLEQAKPKGAVLAKVLGAVATMIDSDYERGQILGAVAENADPSEPLPAEFFTAAGAIESDYERSQVLQKAFDRSSITEAELTQGLTVARGLETDYERGQVLKRVLDRSGLPAEAAIEVVRSTEGLESDYEAGQVLGRLIEKRALSSSEITAVIAAAGRIASDYERAQVLLALANANKLDPAAFEQFVAAAEAMGSDYERDRTLAAGVRSRG